MMYEKDTIKDLMRNYQQLQSTIDYTDAEEDFFSLDKTNDTNLNDLFHSLQHVDDVAGINNLLEMVASECSDKEFFIFLARCEGITYERIGELFQLTQRRIKQIIYNIINKLSIDH